MMRKSTWVVEIKCLSQKWENTASRTTRVYEDRVEASKLDAKRGVVVITIFPLDSGQTNLVDR